MRIISIEKNSDCEIMTVGTTNLIGVILTVKNFWGKTKKIKAFPTNVGPTFGSGIIIYYYFCDELGNRLENESEQINNFLLNQEQLKTA